MAKFQFKNFNKGWYFRQPHLLGLDGWSDVNNFVIYKNAIEKVRGWRRLELVATDSPIDGFDTTTLRVIDDYDQIIDTFT